MELPGTYHPMKGPMVTQTLQDIIGHEPFHWRADRESIEQSNPTFRDCRASTLLSTEEMQGLKQLPLASIAFPPNRFRKHPRHHARFWCSTRSFPELLIRMHRLSWVIPRDRRESLAESRSGAILPVRTASSRIRAWASQRGQHSTRSRRR